MSKKRKYKKMIGYIPYPNTWHVAKEECETNAFPMIQYNTYCDLQNVQSGLESTTYPGISICPDCIAAMDALGIPH